MQNVTVEWMHAMFRHRVQSSDPYIYTIGITPIPQLKPMEDIYDWRCQTSCIHQPINEWNDSDAPQIKSLYLGISNIHP